QRFDDTTAPSGEASGADSSRAAADRVGSERAGSERAGSERADSDRTGADHAGLDRTDARRGEAADRAAHRESCPGPRRLETAAATENFRAQNRGASHARRRTPQRTAGWR